jgi:hypothetical protein
LKNLTLSREIILPSKISTFIPSYTAVSIEVHENYGFLSMFINDWDVSVRLGFGAWMCCEYIKQFKSRDRRSKIFFTDERFGKLSITLLGFYRKRISCVSLPTYIYDSRPKLRKYCTLRRRVPERNWYIST